VDDLMTIEATAAYLQISRGTLAQLRYLGKGPKFYALTPKTIRYSKAQIDEWVRNSERQSTIAA
jgi:predicted DNA-binding transcriptional regulator AlpA